MSLSLHKYFPGDNYFQFIPWKVLQKNLCALREKSNMAKSHVYNSLSDLDKFLIS